jgi:hypothetical protein
MTVENYRYKAWHEVLPSSYYVVVKLYKYGWLGIRYRVAMRRGWSPLDEGHRGVLEKQARLKSEMLEDLNLVPA